MKAKGSLIWPRCSAVDDRAPRRSWPAWFRCKGSLPRTDGTGSDCLSGQAGSAVLTWPSELRTARGLAAPGHGWVPPPALDLPVLPQVLTPAVWCKAQQETSRQGYLTLIRVYHRCPPLDHNSGIGDDRPSHAHDDLALRAGFPPPVLTNGVAAEKGLTKDTGPVRGVRREQVNDFVRVSGLPCPLVALDPCSWLMTPPSARGQRSNPPGGPFWSSATAVVPRPSPEASVACRSACLPFVISDVKRNAARGGPWSREQAHEHRKP